MPQQKYGFTLVELSIVLVILGLLIGGVLTGQSLIRAAELRSVTTQSQRYITAVQTFRDKYFALPGDMTNASAYWGAADGSTGNTTGCLAAVGTGTATCNGNGDGMITIGSTTTNERLRFWQHLANAGLIEGSYDGVGGGTGNDLTATNAPYGRISSSRWYAANWGTTSSSPTQFDGVYDNTLRFGTAQASNTNAAAILKPEEAYNIDTKMDDGKPATGKVVIVVPGGFASCTDATNTGYSTLTANYLLTNTAIACGLQWRQAF